MPVCHPVWKAKQQYWNIGTSITVELQVPNEVKTTALQI